MKALRAVLDRFAVKAPRRQPVVVEDGAKCYAAGSDSK
jgi:hypothetical protein